MDKILVSEYKLFQRSNKANLLIALVHWKIYVFKIEVVPFIINFSTELTTVVKFEVLVQNDADEAVYVVSLTSNSGGYINGRNSANLELLIDKTSSIYKCSCM